VTVLTTSALTPAMLHDYPTLEQISDAALKGTTELGQGLQSCVLTRMLKPVQGRLAYTQPLGHARLSEPSIMSELA
jgi:hypothetical protein